MNLTDRSMTLFEDLANDAGNWSGSPLYMGDKIDNGNLADLKKHGLLTTFKDEGNVFVNFTAAGVQFAAERGIEIEIPDWLRTF